MVRRTLSTALTALINLTLSGANTVFSGGFCNVDSGVNRFAAETFASAPDSSAFVLIKTIEETKK
ncbi:MAG: hypothetical protein ACREBV_02265 [Candidatus Zixiibacteriota bacterium]